MRPAVRTRTRDAVTGHPARRVAALLFALLALVAWPAARASADNGVDFGTPKAVSAFRQAFTFTQPVTLADTPTLVEILITTPFSPTVSVDTPPGTAAAGAQTLSYQMPADSTPANTTVTARWRITTASGAVVVGPAVSVLHEDTRFTWQVKTSGIVRLHWYGDIGTTPDAMLKIANDGIKRASDLLGVTETDPVDFFLYVEQQPMLDALASPTEKNAGGRALAEIRTLMACSQCNDLTITVPHELTHLVFNTATANPFNNPPLWLNEGLASYLSEGYSSWMRQAMAQALAQHSIIPLTALASDFARSDEFKNGLGYAEGTNAVDFAIKTYGQDAFVKMVKSYAQGRTNAQAFSDAFGVDDEAFAAAWLKSIGAATPKRYGPQPAPPNPAIPDSGASSPGPGESPAATDQPAPTDQPTPTDAGARPGATSPVAIVAPSPPAATPPARPGTDLPIADASSGAPIIPIAIVVAILAVLGIFFVVLRGRGRTQPEAPGIANYPYPQQGFGQGGSSADPPVWRAPGAGYPSQPPAYPNQYPPQAPNQYPPQAPTSDPNAWMRPTAYPPAPPTSYAPAQPPAQPGGYPAGAPVPPSWAQPQQPASPPAQPAAQATPAAWDAQPPAPWLSTPQPWEMGAPAMETPAIDLPASPWMPPVADPPTQPPTWLQGQPPAAWQTGVTPPAAPWQATGQPPTTAPASTPPAANPSASTSPEDPGPLT